MGGEKVMTVGICRPDGDTSVAWDASDSPHADGIDDPIEQPAGDPGSDDFISAGDGKENVIDQFTMDNSIQGIDSTTTIKIWCYGKCGLNGNERPSIDIYLGTWKEYKILPFTTTKGWHSLIWSVVGGTQAQLDALQVRIKAYHDYAIYDSTAIYCMYAEVTYTELGYAHDFIGIPSRNIDSIMGIPSANIDNIMGL